MSPKDGSLGDAKFAKYTVNHEPPPPPPATTMTTQSTGVDKTMAKEKDNATMTPPVKRSWREKIRLVANNVTVEPILAAYIMPSVLSNLATQNLNLEKACRVNMAYGDEVCDALTRRQTANYTL